MTDHFQQPGNSRTEIYQELAQLRLIDPHTHINPHAPASTTLADLLGYHYYTELAHSAGMPKSQIEDKSIGSKELVERLVGGLAPLENTVQYSWLISICKMFFGFEDDRLHLNNWESLYDRSEQIMSSAQWPDMVLDQSNIEAVFLTNDFDDDLAGFDSDRYIPCLRTDDLVFNLADPDVRGRLAACSGIELDGSLSSLRGSLRQRFEHFVERGARACAISLPPEFSPMPVADGRASTALDAVLRNGLTSQANDKDALARRVFWTLAELCDEFDLPFDLMIGVNRKVYPGGVYQGQDLYDSRVSLIQYRELFNAFPDVKFPVSVLASVTNQELVSYAWIFPNVYPNGHWWYSNTPSTITHDLAARLEAVPRTKLIGYYSDAYKLEFVWPKFDMYRKMLSGVLADQFVADQGWSIERAVELGRQVLKDNTELIFPRKASISPEEIEIIPEDAISVDDLGTVEISDSGESDSAVSVLDENISTDEFKTIVGDQELLQPAADGDLTDSGKASDGSGMFGAVAAAGAIASGLGLATSAGGEDGIGESEPQIVAETAGDFDDIDDGEVEVEASTPGDDPVLDASELISLSETDSSIELASLDNLESPLIVEPEKLPDLEEVSNADNISDEVSDTFDTVVIEPGAIAPVDEIEISDDDFLDEPQEANDSGIDISDGRSADEIDEDDLEEFEELGSVNVTDDFEEVPDDLSDLTNNAASGITTFDLPNDSAATVVDESASSLLTSLSDQEVDDAESALPSMPAVFEAPEPSQEGEVASLEGQLDSLDPIPDDDEIGELNLDDVELLDSASPASHDSASIAAELDDEPLDVGDLLADDDVDGEDIASSPAIEQLRGESSFIPDGDSLQLKADPLTGEFTFDVDADGDEDLVIEETALAEHEFIEVTSEDAPLVIEPEVSDPDLVEPASLEPEKIFEPEEILEPEEAIEVDAKAEDLVEAAKGLATDVGDLEDVVSLEDDPIEKGIEGFGLSGDDLGVDAPPSLTELSKDSDSSDDVSHNVLDADEFNLDWLEDDEDDQK